MKKPVLIYADFMKIDDEGRHPLICFGTHKDLAENNISLKEGMKLVFYNDDEDKNGNSDDLVVQGIIEFDRENNRYAARIIWDDIKNISQLSLKEKESLGFL